MAEKSVAKNRKRKHFEIEKNRQSPFQNKSSKRPTPAVVSKAPRGINVVEFAESRALEIQNMMVALSNASESSNKRVFQSIPRHMRRRAASHNAKRMPVRLREAYKREEAKSQEKMKDTKKKKSRRQRRKPSNMLEEFNRRQRKHVWLETHIWHAKRFKMAEQWGYKIPLYPNDKSVRASYRAMATSCLMQDISYYQCVEVSGKQEQIIAALRHLTNSNAGLTLAAKHYLNGSIEGRVILYEYDKYPWNAIGPVRFLWQQHLETTKANSTSSSFKQTTKLWVWAHPACRDDVSREIIRACSLEGRTKLTKEKDLELEATNSGKNQETKVLAESELSDEPSDFVVSILKEQLVRFRLTGPKSHSLLASMLELSEWGTTKDDNEQPGSRWWQQYSSDHDCRKSLVDQNALWEQMKGVPSPGYLASGSVLALVVKDPRLALPVRKSSIDMASERLYGGQKIGEPVFTRCPAGTAVSPIWDLSVREEVKKNKLPEKELNELRSKMVVPGSRLKLGDDEPRIPVLVIQRPGTKGNAKTGSVEFGCGYDVIIPAGWSMAFWIALVYRGARVGGSRELATCSREQAFPHFPCDFPDTKAGCEFNESLGKTGGEKYARYPPAKRPNYDKLGVLSPFHGDWGRLIDEWSSEFQKLEVEMDKLILEINPHRKVFDGCKANRQTSKQNCTITSRDKIVDSWRGTVTSRDDAKDSRDEMIMSRSMVVKTREEKETSRDEIVMTGDEMMTTRDEIITTRDKIIPTRDKVMSSRDKVISSRDKIIPSRDEIKPTRDEIMTTRDKTMPSRDEIKPTRDEIQPTRDEIIQARDEAETSRDELVSRQSEELTSPSDNSTTGLNQFSDHGLHAMTLPSNQTMTETDHPSTPNGTLEQTASSSPSSSNVNYFVNRSSSTRHCLEQIVQDLQTRSPRKTKTNSAHQSTFSGHIDFLRTNLESCSPALIAVNLLMLFKGCPLANAIIFIPTLEDLRVLAKDKNYGGPIEPVRRSNKEEPSKDLTSCSLMTACSRKAIGFVSSGEYSFARGQGSAVGFCAFPGICEIVLLSWREKCRPLVLVRNTTSFQYRFASLHIV